MLFSSPHCPLPLVSVFSLSLSSLAQTADSPQLSDASLNQEAAQTWQGALLTVAGLAERKASLSQRESEASFTPKDFSDS